MAAPSLYTTDLDQFTKLTNQLTKLQTEKAEKEDCWLAAAEKAETIALGEKT